MNYKISAASKIRSILPRRLDLKSLIDSVCDAFREVLAQHEIKLEIDVPSNLWVELDPLLIREALRKLLDNAVEAMPSGGALTITSLISRQGLEIEIADSGPGIPEEMLGRVFEPFVSGKQHHAGLGLSMVRDIATAHQGVVTATDCPDGGAAFTLVIPLRSARMAA